MATGFHWHKGRSQAPQSARDADPRDAAAAWVARRDAGLTPDEERAFRAWLAADPRHRSAMDAIGATWARLDSPRLAGAENRVLASLERRSMRRRRRRTLVVACGGMAAAAALTFGLFPDRAIPPAELRTPAPAYAAALEEKVLPDGSTVDLQEGAGLTVQYSGDIRRVALERGSAHFTVARDPERPFLVAIGRVQLRAVGTAFSVQRKGGQVEVVVTEGRVAVEEASFEGAEPRPARTLALLGSDEGLLLDADRPSASPPRPLSLDEREASLTWRNPRIEFSGTPLSEAVRLMNRYNRIQFIISDSAIAERRVSGLIYARNVDGFLRLLEVSLGIEADTNSPDVVALRPRP